MARETVNIGGRDFTISTFPAFEGLRIAGDLQKQFLAPLLSTLDGKEAGDPGSFTAQLMQGIERVSREMDGDKLVKIAERLLSPDYVFVDVDGDRRRLDKATLPQVLVEVADLVELCIAIVRINFAPLVERAASLIGAARTRSLTSASPGSGASSRPN